jgi:hypothetical protein
MTEPIRFKRSALVETAEHLLRHPESFTLCGSHVVLRPYQEEAVKDVIHSVRNHLGLTFIWIFPRQSGKDEALALMMQYLLVIFSEENGGEFVFFNPTFKPQTETSMRRLESRLQSSALTRGRWRRRSGYIYQLGMSNCTYMSADPSAHIVGATANRLLLINEAQDITPFRYDKDIDPMVASVGATKLFSGTRWTSDTLLEREYKAAAASETADGIRRIFFFTADDVRESVPAYGRYVDGVIAKFGRQHPLVKTQYFCETIDTQVGMFSPARQMLMLGSHKARTEPEAGKMYSFLIDVAGQDECAGQLHAATAPADDTSHRRAFLSNPGRDSTALKIVEIDPSTIPELGKPVYRVVHRRLWTGEKHVTVYGALHALAQTWRPFRIVIDAIGVGEGLWSLLDNALGPDVVIPVKFTAQVKSNIGYGFLGIIESGRYREYDPMDETFRQQMDKCRSEIVQGPLKQMRWGVPDDARDAAGSQVHDDDLITGALCQVLDNLNWAVPTQPQIAMAADPLADMERNY